MDFFHLITGLLPRKKEDESIKPRAIFLDERDMYSPALAIEFARKEFPNMAGILNRRLRAVIILFIQYREDIFSKCGPN
jgi:Na+/phosphate symporter